MEMFTKLEDNPKKNKKKKPRGRAHKRMPYNRCFVTFLPCIRGCYSSRKGGQKK
ncbi:hypothetical protein MKX01_008431 [Papaver californicum]|nr:hypothetical protein MKX01_008431 [Papaver californicum]